MTGEAWGMIETFAKRLDSKSEKTNDLLCFIWLELMGIRDDLITIELAKAETSLKGDAYMDKLLTEKRDIANNIGYLKEYMNSDDDEEDEDSQE